MGVFPPRKSHENKSKNDKNYSRLKPWIDFVIVSLGLLKN